MIKSLLNVFFIFMSGILVVNLVLIGSFLQLIQSQVAPTWVTSSFLKAASFRIINGDACGCKTNNRSTPTASITFSSAFPAPPNLGFGISNYQGDDYLASEMFEINRTGLTASGFSIKMQISGFTHLWVVEIRYVGISKSFPHHLNSFDNVPVNYTKGPLVNITIKNASATTYSNTINYTEHCNLIGATYKYFSTPLTNNKILLFMTSLFVQGTSDFTANSPANPLTLFISATPLTTETYVLLTNVGPKTSITRLHFSMITFDQMDVQASGQYLLVYQRIQFGSSGGFYSFPQQFLTNFMIGFTQFSSSRCGNTIHFVLNFVTVSGSYGVQMLQSVPRPTGNPPLSRFNYTVFYLKTWTCPVNTVFNPDTNMCISCPLANCLTCFNLTACSVCNQAGGYFLNSTSLLCQPCAVPGCITCTTLTTCSDCNETQNYVLATNLSCTLCNSAQNMFANIATQTCQLCTLSQCVTCASLTQCSACNTTAFYYVGTGGTCQYCDPGLNYLINPVTKNCVQCTIPNCANCSTLSICRTCATNYLLKPADSLCYVCPLSNCVTCSTFTACSVCNALANYTLNTATGLCQLCSMTGCLTCTTTTICGQCNTVANYKLNSGGTCSLCPANTFANNTVVPNTCDACTLTGCTTCQTLTSCSVCNSAGSYYLNTGGTCSYCNPNNNTFINPGTLACDACTLTECVVCSSLTACTSCDLTANYLLNTTDNLCYLCGLSNCVECTNFTACSVCDVSSGFTIDPATGLCVVCPLVGCSNCSDINTCYECSIAGNYIKLPDNTCQQCAIGYFANSVLEICENCTQANCSVCATLLTCSQCDMGNLSYIQADGSCSYCDPTQNRFLNTTNNPDTCELCSLANCITCTSLIACSVCNETAGFFLNSSDNLCYPCNVASCLVCEALNNCSVCDTVNDYALNLVTEQCQVCTLVGCLNCSSTTTCVECNETDNFLLITASETCHQCNTSANQFLNTATSACQPCTLLPQCLVCSSLTQCTSCDVANNYYVDLVNLDCNYCDHGLNMLINTTSLQCELCLLANCLNCSNLTACQDCNQAAGFFLNATTGLCQPCALLNCLTCATLSTCSVCDRTAGFTINLISQLCEPCSLLGCTNCSDTLTCVDCDSTTNYILVSGGTCQQCNSSANFFANETSQLCQLCVVSNCLTCSSLTTCSQCDLVNLYYVLPGLTCGYCDAINNTFINTTSEQCQSCVVWNCLNCSSLTTCRECDPDTSTFLNSTDFKCYPCMLQHCFECQTLTTCKLCDESSQFFLNSSNGQCQACSLPFCITCSSLTICTECDYFNNYGFDFTSPNMSQCGTCNVSCTCDGYGMPWNSAIQQCTPICGDGLLRLGEECDDGNLDPNDGCSASCTTELFYTCIGQPSFCNQTIMIVLDFVSIERSGCNQFKVVVNSPMFTLSQIQNNFRFLNPGVNIIKKEQNQSNIEITAEYTRNIASQPILLDFWPGLLLNITYDPELVALRYNEEECQATEQIEALLQAVQIISYGILLVSLLSCKIVGLELFGVLQLSYFSLSQHSFLNVYLAPLTKFKTFNGLNVALTSESVSLPSNLNRMDLSSSFINNCNVMLFVMFAELIVSVCVYLGGKLGRKTKVEKVGKRLLKQGFVTLVLFNIFNIAFSAGMHWRFASPEDPGYIISTLVLFGTLAAMLISVTAMELTAKQDYGQFKNKFKKVWICQLYIPLTAFYRMAMGFYTAVQSDYQESTLLVMGFSFLFLFYFAVNLPFTNVYQNYRAGLVQATMLYTLFTANYYRSMKSTTQLQVKGKIYTPAIIQLVLMVLSIVLSFVVLLYQIYQIVQKYRKDKKLNRLQTQGQVLDPQRNVNNQQSQQNIGVSYF